MNSAAGLAKRIGIPRQKLNYHIRQLEKQGLVEEVGERIRERIDQSPNADRDDRPDRDTGDIRDPEPLRYLEDALSLPEQRI